jgi:hypothetical protein
LQPRKCRIHDDNLPKAGVEIGSYPPLGAMLRCKQSRSPAVWNAAPTENIKTNAFTAAGPPAV